MAGEIPETSVYSAAVDCFSRRGLERGGPFRTVREPDGKPAALHYKLLQSDLNRHPVRCNRADYSCLGVQEPYYGGAFFSFTLQYVDGYGGIGAAQNCQSGALCAGAGYAYPYLRDAAKPYRATDYHSPDTLSNISFGAAWAQPARAFFGELIRRARSDTVQAAEKCSGTACALARLYLRRILRIFNRRAHLSKGSRLTQMGAEIAAYQLRIEWTRKSLVLFAQRPLFGYGVASIRREFEKMNAGNEGARGAITANPHN